MTVRHFYHCFAGGHWCNPVAEHLGELDAGGYDQELTVALVGPAEQRELVRHQFATLHPQAEFVEAEQGHEQVTIREVATWAAEHDGIAIYAHSKGASYGPGSDAGRLAYRQLWRRSMAWRVIRQWRENIDRLTSGGYDLAGCHWVSPGIDFQTVPEQALSGPILAGNFWLAQTSYLRRLEPVPSDDRHDAETWVGQGSPRVLDLLPGMPGGQLVEPLGVQRLIVPR